MQRFLLSLIESSLTSFRFFSKLSHRKPHLHGWLPELRMACEFQTEVRINWELPEAPVPSLAGSQDVPLKQKQVSHLLLVDLVRDPRSVDLCGKFVDVLSVVSSLGPGS